MIYTILFILTLLFSAFFSGSETAFIAANRLKLRLSHHNAQAEGGFPRLLQSDQRFLTSTLVGNNIMMVACSSLAVVVFSSFVNKTMLVVFTTAFLLLFGEILPKSIAAQIPNRLAQLSYKLLSFFTVLFFPLIWFTELMSQIFVRLFSGVEDQQNLFSKYELPVLVQEYSSIQHLANDDHQLLHRSLKFLEKRLWDVMVPRTDIIGVEADASMEKVIRTFKKSGYSRLPVYQKSLDAIKGFYYVLDFFNEYEHISKFLRPPLVLPESMNIMEALRRLQKEHVSIAVAVDEHGGTAGLATVEDIIESLVGAINDEFDKHRFHIRLVGEQALVAEGRTTIDELRDKLEIPLPESEFVTIAGLVQENLGRIAQAGDIVDLPNCKVKVLEATETKIKKVWIVKKPD